MTRAIMRHKNLSETGKGMGGGTEAPNRVSCSDSSTATSNSGVTDWDGGHSVSRRSLTDRARIFDKSYLGSRRMNQDHGTSLRALLDASTHRRHSKVIHGRRSSRRDPSNPGTSSEVARGSILLDNPKLQELMEASERRNKFNRGGGISEEDGASDGSCMSRDGMHNLLEDTSRLQKKLMRIGSKHRLAHRMMLTSEQSSERLVTLRRVKNRIKPSLPEGVVPLKPTETTFQNVMAPKLAVNVETFEVPVFPKTISQSTLIQEAMVTSYVLKYQSPATSQAIVDGMEPLEFRKGQILQRQGEVRPDDDQLFVVEEGTLQVQVDGQLIRTIEAGQIYGQERLLYQAGANTATLRAGTAITKVFGLHQVTFRVLQLKHYRRVLDELQANVPKVHTSTTWRDDIYNNQEDDDSYEEYSVDTEDDYDYDDENDEYFDEEEFVADNNKAETASFDESSTVASFTDVAITNSESIDVSMTSKRKAKSCRRKPAHWCEEPSPIIQHQESIMKSVHTYANSEEELEFIKILGEGQFGKVWLVAANLPDQVPVRQEFALKVQAAVYDKELDVIRKEIRALHALRHPFICDLVHTYERENSFDLLVGLIPGGELWGFIHREQENGSWISGMPEGRARFFAYVLTNTLGYIHSQRYIYRDLKPENVMVDADGYPIIVDFGFTKYLEPGEKTHTFCGTPNYIAPEVITSMGHGKEVDFWALGVVIYEMVSGDNPFFHDGMEQSEMYEAIVDQDPYEMRDGVTATDQVRELTDLLLLKDPQERLGALGFQEILDHPWFVGLPPISDILHKTLSADRLSEWAFDEVQFVEESNNNGTIADGSEEPEDLLDTESDVSVQLELPQDFRRPPKELSLNLDDSSLDGTILPLSQGHASARTVSVEGLIVKHDAGRTQSVSAPSTPKQKLIDRWTPRKKGLGYYVTMLSPADRENSRSRRGVVDSFLARYLDGVDVDSDDNLKNAPWGETEFANSYTVLGKT